jgi:signal peptidase I
MSGAEVDATAGETVRWWRRNPFIDLVIILALAFTLAYALQAWVAKPYRIPSLSMLPTLEDGDRVLAARFVYRLHDPHRGDVIVFHPPGAGEEVIRGANGAADVSFIKRVIGLPGETVQIISGRVLICVAPRVACTSLDEPYLRGRRDLRSFGPVTVPDGRYFVLGDNRLDSDDSRDWGSLPRDNIVGQALGIYWPLDRLGSL